MTLPPLLLGMIVRDEASMLRRTLLEQAAWPFHYKVALDTGSRDGSPEVLRKHGFSVFYRAWHSDFSRARNDLLLHARAASPDGWLLMLDADECMWPADFERLQTLCSVTKADLITLPRYNLAKGGTLWMHDSYPDKQPRLLRLSAPLEFRGKVHEVVHYEGHSLNVPGEGLDHFASACHIYHYGLCKPPANNWLRSHRYSQIAAGEEELPAAPGYAHISEDHFLKQLAERHSFRPFTENHPLKGATWNSIS